MHGFRTFDLAREFYRQSQKLELSNPMRDQLHRAALSIPLNLAEGRGKSSTKEQLRFFRIAMGSVREAQAILQLAELDGSEAWRQLDALAASLYKLIHRAQ